MPDPSSEHEAVETQVEDSEVVNAAESTPAEEERSPLDVLSESLEQGVEADSPTAESRSNDAGDGTHDAEPGAEKKDQAPAEGENEEDADPSEDEIKQYSPNAQQRIRGLVEVKNELRAEVESLNAQIEPLQSKASAFDELQGYLTDHGISEKEANNALELTRLIKTGDYQTAYRLIRPLFEDLHGRVGGILDKDLAEKVRLGHLPQQEAREIQRHRAQERQNREQGQRREEQARKDEESRRATAYTNMVNNAARVADDWAKAQADLDPDFKVKQDMVADKMLAMLQSKGPNDFPRTKEAVEKICKDALDAVNKQLSPFAPRPKPVNAPQNAGPTSQAPASAPQSPLEAIERGLEMTRPN